MIDQSEQPTSGPAWHVVRIEDTSAYLPGKGAVRTTRVVWQLYDGTESYTDFAASNFKLADAQKTIDAAAKLLYATLQLKGDTIDYSSG